MRHCGRTSALIVLCAFALAIIASSTSLSAANGVSTRVTRDARAAFADSTRELPGGIIETVRILARQAISKDPGAPLERGGFVDVFITRFDPATGQTTFFSASEVEVAPGQLQISPGLATARLTADIPVTDSTGTSQVVSIDLRWRASETSEAAIAEDFLRTAAMISLTTNADETRRGATVSGTVTYPLGTVTDLTGQLAKQEIVSRTFLLRTPGQQGPASITSSSTVIEGSALFALASYATEISECVIGVVDVFAEVPADDAPRVDIRVTEFDGCTGAFTAFEATDLALPAGAFEIAADFSSARLNTPIDVGGQILTLDLTWSSGEQLSSQTLRHTVATPTGFVTATFQGIFSEAVLTGSVTTPTQAIPVPEATVGLLGSQFAGSTTTQR